MLIAKRASQSRSDLPTAMTTAKIFKTFSLLSTTPAAAEAVADMGKVLGSRISPSSGFGRTRIYIYIYSWVFRLPEGLVAYVL